MPIETVIPINEAPESDEQEKERIGMTSPVKSTEELETSENGGYPVPTADDIKFCKLATVPMFIFGLISQILVYGSIGFLGPTLALHLLKYQDFDEFWVAIYFGVPSIIYVLNTPLVSVYVKIINRRCVLLIGSLLLCMGVYFVGSSPMLGLEDSSKYIFVGLCLIGFSAALIVIPLFPEMLVSIETKLPELAGDELNNVSAGYFNAFIGVGEALGPISASLMVHKWGFRNSQDIVATLMFIYCVLFFAVNGNCSILSCVKDDQDKDEHFS